MFLKSFKDFRKDSHTAVELIFVILVIAILAGIAVFRANPDSLLRTDLRNTAYRLASDLRLTRSLAITRVDPHSLVIRPLNRDYRILNSKGTQVGETRSIAAGIAVSDDMTFTFGALGDASSGRSVSLRAGTAQYDIAVTPATGMIQLKKH